MKKDRQRILLEIIASQEIQTQEDLVSALQAAGCPATQATVSRDIRELRLIKVPTESGRSRYAEPRKVETRIDSRMIRILKDTLVSLDHAGHMIIIKTMSGSANVAGEVIDTLGWPEILGTIAGDNTILAVVRHEQNAAEGVDRIQRMIDGEA